MSATRDAQSDLVLAILAGEASAGLAPVADGVGVARGLAAYRNNLKVLAGQALAASFPRLAEALGEQDFAVMAWSYWRADPPRRGDLAEWGQSLPDFLRAHAGEDSGLPRLARLDWAVHRAERAADVALVAESLAWLGSEPLDGVTLRLRPAVQVVGDTLVWREGWKAQERALSAPEAAFFLALGQGCSLGEALAATTVKGPGGSDDFDFSAWLQDALRHEWLHDVVRLPTVPSESSE